MKNKKIRSFAPALLNVSMTRTKVKPATKHEKVNHPLLHESTAPNQ
jgi:hypothetical protein